MQELYIYIRVSTAGQVDDGNSLDGQKRAGELKAKELGLRPVFYQDAGRSANNEAIETRPEFSTLMSKVKRGEVEYLWTWDITRLSRNDIAKAKIITLLKQKDVKYYEGNSLYDFNNNSSKLLFDIMSAVASHDAEIRKTRFQLGSMQAKRKGKYLGPMQPYGFSKNEEKYLVINPEEEKVLRRVYDQYMSGKGFGIIARELNEDNIPTRTLVMVRDKQWKGKVTVWNSNSLRHMMRGTAIKGILTFKNEDGNYETAKCPNIFTDVEWKNIQDRISSNATPSGGVPKYFYLLNEKIRCGSCGSQMLGRVKHNRGEFVYKCTAKRSTATNHSKCNNRSINIFGLNKLIVKELLASNEAFESTKQMLSSEIGYSSLEKLKEREEVSLSKIEVFNGAKPSIVNMRALGHLDDKELAEELEKLTINIAKEQENLNTIRANIRPIQARIESKSQLDPIKDVMNLRDRYLAQLLGEQLNSNLDDNKLARQVVELYVDEVVSTFSKKTKQYSLVLNITGKKTKIIVGVSELTRQAGKYRKGFNLSKYTSMQKQVEKLKETKSPNLKLIEKLENQLEETYRKGTMSTAELFDTIRNSKMPKKVQENHGKEMEEVE